MTQRSFFLPTAGSTGFPPPYRFRMLGRFECLSSSGNWAQLDNSKVHQTLAYLLLHHDRAHQRQTLSGTLWSSPSKASGRKNLRQSLWLLQSRTLPEINGAESGDSVPLLLRERDWVRVNAEVVWVDVVELVAAFARVRGVPGETLDRERSSALKAVVELYRGDLLEGWTDAWCVYERERIRVMYLSMLEKLLGHCEAVGEYEEGLVFGEQLLRYDRAHERAHRRMMRLSYGAGDRTSALRQYERCCAALQQELGLGPSQATEQLYQQMRQGVFTALSSRS